MRRSSSTRRIVELVTALAAKGKRVILAGTDTDFRGEPFGPMPQLSPWPRSSTSCTRSASAAATPLSRNQRLIGGKPARYDSPTIMVGKRESYEARCRHCHEVPRRDERPVEMKQLTS